MPRNGLNLPLETEKADTGRVDYLEQNHLILVSNQGRDCTVM